MRLLLASHRRLLAMTAYSLSFPAENFGDSLCLASVSLTADTIEIKELTRTNKTNHRKEQSRYELLKIYQ